MDQQPETLAASMHAQLIDPNVLAQLTARCDDAIDYEGTTEKRQAQQPRDEEWLLS